MEKKAPLDDNAIVETSHGPATVSYVRGHDLPYWRAAAVHAIAAYDRHAALIGAPPLRLFQASEAGGPPKSDLELAGNGTGIR